MFFKINFFPVCRILTFPSYDCNSVPIVTMFKQQSFVIAFHYSLPIVPC